MEIEFPEGSIQKGELKKILGAVKPDTSNMHIRFHLFVVR